MHSHAGAWEREEQLHRFSYSLVLLEQPMDFQSIVVEFTYLPGISLVSSTLAISSRTLMTENFRQCVLLSGYLRTQLNPALNIYNTAASASLKIFDGRITDFV